MKGIFNRSPAFFINFFYFLFFFKDIKLLIGLPELLEPSG